jgi:hypothetical protein
MLVCDQWLRNDFLARHGEPFGPECGCPDCPPFPEVFGTGAAAVPGSGGVEAAPPPGSAGTVAPSAPGWGGPEAAVAPGSSGIPPPSVPDRRGKARAAVPVHPNYWQAEVAAA